MHGLPRDFWSDSHQLPVALFLANPLLYPCAFDYCRACGFSTSDLFEKTFMILLL